MDPYILIPSLSANTELVEMYSQQGVDVINTYNLSTIFSGYELDRPTEVIDKYQFVSALARLVGATAGSDTSDYLEDKGIDVNTSSYYQPLTYEVALDLYVRTYAYRHQIDLDRVYISNYNLIEDKDDIDGPYLETLNQGANLGIIEVDSGPPIYPPKHYLNMDDVIKLLTTLHNGLN